jgi:hypothetical protein
VKDREQICTEFVHKPKYEQNLEELKVNEDNITMGFQKLNERVNKIYLFLDRIKWQSAVNTVLT